MILPPAPETDADVGVPPSTLDEATSWWVSVELETVNRLTLRPEPETEQ